MENVVEKLVIGTEPEIGNGPCGAEGGRSPTEAPQGRSNEVAESINDSSEVQPCKQRKKHTVHYKLKILEELDACKTAEERGAVIRREGLYASRISSWRKQRREGTLNLAATKRGRKLLNTQENQMIESLQQENLNLKKQLKQAEMIIDVQKKVSALFGVSQTDIVLGEKKS